MFLKLLTLFMFEDGIRDRPQQHLYVKEILISIC